jgi:lysozyme
MAPILGFDLSANNSEGHPVEWDKIPRDKVRFVYMKATEGATYKDPWFDRHWTSARALGLACGAYHFFHSNRPGKAQADNIARNVLRDPRFGAGNLPVAIDVEELKSVDLKAAASVKSFLKELDACAAAVEKTMGRKPVIYTAGYVWQALGFPANYVEYPLWIAQPAKEAVPKLPKPFTQWALWQYSFQGKLAGMTGPVDLDRFKGGEAEFQALLLK